MQHIITLLTDFGTQDTYVGQLKASILGVCRECQLVDVTHQVAPQDVLQAALFLAEAAFVFPIGTVHLAVIDPGVGTERRMVAARIEGHLFVLPDNGLLTYVLQDRVCEQAVVLDKPAFWRGAISHTFHGRDIMGPVAGHLAGGRQLTEIGTPTETLGRLPIPDFPADAVAWADAEPANSRLARVLHIDRYGNVILDLAMAESSGDRHRIRVGDQTDTAQLVQTYGQASQGQLVLLRGSSNRWELAVVGGSAAGRLGAEPGQIVVLSHE